MKLRTAITSAALALGALAALAAVPAAAQCGDAGATVVTRNGASASVGSVTISVMETEHRDVCAGGQSTTTTGMLSITDGATVLCSRPADPSFDPFFFGAGIHDATSEPCGADLTWDGLADAPIPDAPGGTGVSATKSADVTGTYWHGGSTHTVPDGSRGSITRGADVPVDEPAL